MLKRTMFRWLISSPSIFHPLIRLVSISIKNLITIAVLTNDQYGRAIAAFAE